MDPGGGETLDQLESDLHVRLLGSCSNGALLQAITYPQSLIIAHRFLYRWTSGLFATEPFLPEHLEVIERLRAGRIVEAAKALEAHLRVSLPGHGPRQRHRHRPAARPPTSNGFRRRGAVDDGVPLGPDRPCGLEL